MHKENIAITAISSIVLRGLLVTKSGAPHLQARRVVGLHPGLIA